MNGARASVLRRLAAHLCAVDLGHPLRVGIDGICGSGKTTFGSELVEEVSAAGRSVVHLDSDGFHQSRDIRYRQGRESAHGYYEDAYDFSSLVRLTLEPLGPGGRLVYATSVHDLASDEPRVVWNTAARDAVVVFDATFLQRDELRAFWDLVVYLDVPREVAYARGVARDADQIGGVDAARRAYATRYMAACDLYVAEQDPRGRADVVVDNTDPERPSIVRGVDP